jgi:hypothetical protein
MTWYRRVSHGGLTVRSGKSNQTIGVGLLVIATGGAALLTAILESRRHQPAYAMPVVVVLIAGLCVVLIAAGGGLALKATQLEPWLAPVAVVALMFAFLEAGVFIVVPLVLLLVLVSRRGPAARRSAPRWQSLGAPVLLTLGIVPLSWLALDRPVVECLANGVSSATPVWTWFGGGSISGTSSESGGGGSSSSSAPQQTSGSITAGGVTYAYTCDGTRLVRFTSG